MVDLESVVVVSTLLFKGVLVDITYGCVIQ